MRDNLTTQDEVKRLFLYDKDTGNLVWRTNRKGHYIQGKVVGYRGDSGYLKTTVRCKHYLVHQLVYLYHYGYIPENFIDHIDKDPTNNRIENLREVTHQCNLRNSKINKNNKSGVKGVFSFNDLWIAQIQVNKRTIRLYVGGDFIEATAHRLAAEQAENWSGCETNSPSYTLMRNYVKRV